MKFCLVLCIQCLNCLFLLTSIDAMFRELITFFSTFLFDKGNCNLAKTNSIRNKMRLDIACQHEYTIKSLSKSTFRRKSLSKDNRDKIFFFQPYRFIYIYTNIHLYQVLHFSINFKIVKRKWHATWKMKYQKNEKRGYNSITKLLFNICLYSRVVSKRE